jgi:Spy/CpxP family protein refolding chaperone
MKRFATLLFLLTLAAVPATAAGIAGHGAHGAPGTAAAPGQGFAHHFDHIAKALNLTDEQKAQAKPLADELQATIAPLFADLKTKHDAVRAALDSNADATTVGEAAIAAHAVEQQIKAAHDKFATAFAALLTPDQLTKFNALKAEHDGPHGGFGRRGHAQ